MNLGSCAKLCFYRAAWQGPTTQKCVECPRSGRWGRGRPGLDLTGPRWRFIQHHMHEGCSSINMTVVYIPGIFLNIQNLRKYAWLLKVTNYIPWVSLSKITAGSFREGPHGIVPIILTKNTLCSYRLVASIAVRWIAGQRWNRASRNSTRDQTQIRDCWPACH
jgi:hypothetical protein